jgi:hypothetical protein
MIFCLIAVTFPGIFVFALQRFTCWSNFGKRLSHEVRCTMVKHSVSLCITNDRCIPSRSLLHNSTDPISFIDQRKLAVGKEFVRRRLSSRAFFYPVYNFLVIKSVLCRLGLPSLIRIAFCTKVSCNPAIY